MTSDSIRGRLITGYSISGCTFKPDVHERIELNFGQAELAESFRRQ
jgi:hypothetical protein